MRKIDCFDIPGEDVVSVLEEFNERAEEFGITNEADIISISVRADPKPHAIAVPNRPPVKSEVIVTFFYWNTT